MKKWLLFSLLATIGCGALAIIFASMAGPELMKEYGQRAARIQINNVASNRVTQRLDVQDIDSLTLKSRAIDIEVVTSPDETLYVEYATAVEQNKTEFPEHRSGRELTLDVEEFVQNERHWKFDVFQDEDNIRIRAEDAHVIVKIPARIQIVTLQTISGSIKTQNLQLRKLVANVVSGDIKISSGQVEAIEIKSVSGDLKLETSVKQIEARSVSGQLEMHLPRADVGVEAETTSGDIRLRYAVEPDALLSFKSMSGEIEISAAQRMKSEGALDNFKMGEGHGYIKIKTISGDAKVETGRLNQD